MHYMTSVHQTTSRVVHKPNFNSKQKHSASSSTANGKSPFQIIYENNIYSKFSAVKCAFRYQKRYLKLNLIYLDNIIISHFTRVCYGFQLNLSTLFDLTCKCKSVMKHILLQTKTILKIRGQMRRRIGKSGMAAKMQ